MMNVNTASLLQQNLCMYLCNLVLVIFLIIFLSIYYKSVSSVIVRPHRSAAIASYSGLLLHTEYELYRIALFPVTLSGP